MERMKPTAYKIGEWERKSLSKDMQEVIGTYQEENNRLEEENKSLKAHIDYLTLEVEDREKSCALMSDENKNLKEKIQTLELWLDNKEKLNEEYRKQIDKLKSENEYRNSIADIIPEWKWNVAEETIKDLQERIKELKAELDKYKNDIIYEEWLYD